MSDSPSRTIVYIDGSNLYYSIRFTPYRWVNPLELSRRVFPSLEIQKVKYFTALVNPHSDDPQARSRHETYLRALRTLEPELEVYEGHVSRRKARMALAWGESSWWRRLLLALALSDRQILSQHPPRVRVWKNEEKGSDVSLASHLVADAYEESFDVAAVLSNDVDLEQPIRLVRERLGKPVALFNAASFRHPRLAPKEVPGSSYAKVENEALCASQFPVQMSDADGTFRRPHDWESPHQF